MKPFLALILLLWVSLCGSSETFSQELQVGQQVHVHADKPVGVPLHRDPAPSYMKHVPSGTPATILNIAGDTRWILLRLPNQETAWVHRKYVKAGEGRLDHSASSTKPDKLASGKAGEEAVWTSRETCQEAVGQGNRMVPETDSTLRLATWNIRWFPLGKSSEQPEDFAQPTDLEWLICAIRWMQIDILAIQESVATPDAARAWKTVITSLTQQTEKTWRWHRQPCGRPDDHQIGLLWNDSRVSLSEFDSLWHFNARARSAADACNSGLRPGQYAYVQARKSGGADFHLVAIHLKSGPTVFAVEDRHKALNRIDQALAPFLARDRDVVILGDFNTMGAGDWRSRDTELKNLRRKVAKEEPGFLDLDVQPQCSHYFRGRGGWLDHVLVPRGMEEITASSATVTGYCAVADCRRIRGDYPPAYRALSDHCPVVVPIHNRDQD